MKGLTGGASIMLALVVMVTMITFLECKKHTWKKNRTSSRQALYIIYCVVYSKIFHNFLFQEYKKELETYFDDFCDLAQTFPLYHGKGHHQPTDTDEIVGFFKVLYNTSSL